MYICAHMMQVRGEDRGCDDDDVCVWRVCVCVCVCVRVCVCRSVGFFRSQH